MILILALSLFILNGNIFHTFLHLLSTICHFNILNSTFFCLNESYTYVKSFDLYALFIGFVTPLCMLYLTYLILLFDPFVIKILLQTYVAHNQKYLSTQSEIYVYLQGPKVFFPSNHGRETFRIFKQKSFLFLPFYFKKPCKNF